MVSQPISLENLRLYLASGENRLAKVNQSALLKACQKAKIPVQMTPMHVGDLMIAYHHPKPTNSGTDQLSTQKLQQLQQIHERTLENLPKMQEPEYLVPILLIERKTISDFCASQKSGHKKNQHLRMLQFRQNVLDQVRLAFVVEGYYLLKDLDDVIEGVQVSSLETSFNRLQLSDRILVKQVANLKEHVQFLESCIKLIITDQLTYGQGNIRLNSLQSEYQETLKIQKKGNLTVETVYQTQLSCFPGISMTMAGTIASIYPDWASLLAALKQAEKPEKLLSEIKVNNRRLGPARAKKICQSILK